MLESIETAKASMEDVALRAGVSRVTVSRVLNNDSRPSPAMIRKVQAAVKGVGYQVKRSGIRQGPRRRGRRPIRQQRLLLLFGGDEAWLHSPVYSRTLHSIEQRLREEGWTMTLGTPSPGLVGEVMPPRTDGCLLFSAPPVERISPRLLREMRRLDGVVRIMGTPINGDLFDHVLCNNHRIAELAAAHLLARGHREIAIVGHLFAERVDDFAATVSAAGARVHPFIREDFVIDRGMRQAPNHAVLLDTVRELAALSPRPTAIFASTDIIVMGLYNALPKVGLAPGVDIEIIGVNNDALFLDCLHPRPASVDNHAELAGRRAVEQMFWRLEHPRSPRQVVLIDPEMVAGEYDPARGAASQGDGFTVGNMTAMTGGTDHE